MAALAAWRDVGYPVACLQCGRPILPGRRRYCSIAAAKPLTGSVYYGRIGLGSRRMPRVSTRRAILVTNLPQRMLPPVGPRAWRLLAGVLLFEIGTGMTLPLVIVYLHDVKGIGLGDAGIALAAVGLGGVIATVVAGSMVDRVGAGWTAVCGLLLAGVGTAGYLAVDSTGSAIAASAAQGAGFAATWVGVFPS